MRGGSIYAVKELLGDADIKMTLRYSHLAPEHLPSEIAKTEGAGNFNTKSTQSAFAVTPSS